MLVGLNFNPPPFKILRFTDKEHKDDSALRFGYCDNTGKLIARPLYLEENEIEELGHEASKNPEVMSWMRLFFKGCFGKEP